MRNLDWRHFFFVKQSALSGWEREWLKGPSFRQRLWDPLVGDAYDVWNVEIAVEDLNPAKLSSHQNGLLTLEKNLPNAVLEVPFTRYKCLKENFPCRPPYQHLSRRFYLASFYTLSPYLLRKHIMENKWLLHKSWIGRIISFTNPASSWKLTGRLC